MLASRWYSHLPFEGVLYVQQSSQPWYVLNLNLVRIRNWQVSIDLDLMRGIKPPRQSPCTPAGGCCSDRDTVAVAHVNKWHYPHGLQTVTLGLIHELQSDCSLETLYN